MRNAMDSQEVAVGWWPGDTRYGKAAFYAYAHPAPEGFAGGDARHRRRRAGTASSASTCSTGTTSAPPPTRTASPSSFARSAFQHACLVCGWDPELAASAEGTPPPLVP